ncbi:MAG: tRNA dihydrouridine(20/20a) synthase DusA [Alphaproteobacteria bacterium]
MFSSSLSSSRRICVAPMMDWTDRHGRYFLRLITRRALLYTEMVPTAALQRGDRARFLDHHPDEHPLALQLGGGDPAALAECARMAEDWGYDEVNLNAGCPSDRVAAGGFGACLMAEPERVAACVAAMKAAVRVPVTVKHRIGIDDRDDGEHLDAFVRTIVSAGCDAVIIHARKAILGGLSPKHNRTVPPLRHDLVHGIKAAMPGVTVVINGGIVTLDQAAVHLERVDGVMIGRAAFDTPYMLADVDRRFHGDPGPPPTRAEILDALVDYARQQQARGVGLDRVFRRVHGLLRGLPGARAWRRRLQEIILRSNADPLLIAEATGRLMGQL